MRLAIVDGDNEDFDFVDLTDDEVKTLRGVVAEKITHYEQYVKNDTVKSYLEPLRTIASLLES